MAPCFPRLWWPDQFHFWAGEEPLPTAALWWRGSTLHCSCPVHTRYVIKRGRGRNTGLTFVTIQNELRVGLCSSINILFLLASDESCFPLQRLQSYYRHLAEPGLSILQVDSLDFTCLGPILISSCPMASSRGLWELKSKAFGKY